jgi:aspartate carbamoyltransferase catalytic subunit
VHILSAEQFTKEQIKDLFARADYFKKHSDKLADRQKIAKIHQGRQVCTLFFQPSTRTRTSFEAAAAKLGMSIVSTENARENSSSTKGETIEDTFRVLDGYKFDAIVMRHFEAGAAARAASVCLTPVINAGDGTGEHPTQALLDAYTIFSKFGRLDNLKVVFGGDLRYGRTVRSLSRLLSKYKGNHITYVSVPELQINADIKKFLEESDTIFEETADVQSALAEADVVYWTRLQTEYLRDPKSIRQAFSLNKKMLKNLNSNAIVMHPLPRVDEIHIDVDEDPRAVYFEQAANGVFVRMALLDLTVKS